MILQDRILVIHIFLKGKVENSDFTNARLINAEFVDMDFGIYACFKNADLTGARFDNNAWELADFTNANLTGSKFGFLGGTIYFTNANLTDVYVTQINTKNIDFTNATINGAYLNGITREQLYTTANYKNKDLNRVNFSRQDVSYWNFIGQNLTHANFLSSTLTNTNLTMADLRKAAYYNSALADAITKNTIMADGRIENFSMISSDDNFSIRKYTPASEGGEMISAKISEAAAISGGAALTLENGAELEVIDAASLSVANGSSIIINTDADSSTKVLIASDATLAFETGSILSVNIECDEAEYEALQVSIMDFEDGACITGLDALVKGETILLTVNDSEWLGDWDYSIENNQMLISIIPEPATVAAILGAIALTFVIRYKKGHRKNEI